MLHACCWSCADSKQQQPTLREPQARCSGSTSGPGVCPHPPAPALCPGSTGLIIMALQGATGAPAAQLGQYLLCDRSRPGLRVHHSWKTAGSVPDVTRYSSSMNAGLQHPCYSTYCLYSWPTRLDTLLRQAHCRTV